MRFRLEHVSHTPPQGNAEAGDIEEGIEGGEQMLMMAQQAAELTEPGIGSLHDPAAFVSPHPSSIVITLCLVVFAAGLDQFDGPLFQPPPQRIGTVPTPTAHRSPGSAASP